ncbi:(R)-citramalate synthase [Rhodovastum atsumiense]|nr:(R)-citramalate synthase [Rhodovastum atsumiense]
MLYDTTLRDGAQTQGVDFSVVDKQAIATELDRLGIDYIEGGWPGANQTDDAFFAHPPKLRHAVLTAFGMTRRHGHSAANDPGLNAVLRGGTTSVCLVGKSSDRAAELALGVTPAENLDLIGDTVAEAVARGLEVLFDAEHFFDGYRRNPEYALSCLQRAHGAGAAWLVLCDTNGGTLPEQISTIVGAVAAALPAARLGIHTHNDTETAVAGSLAAVGAGARMIQGTINGLGERCGNANLTALIPTLMLKLGYETGINEDGLRRLTEISHMLDERLNRAPNRHAAYVGENAFAHKGGLHAAAMARDSTTYEHISPERVGNRRHIIVSEQAGRANLLSRLAEIGITVDPDDRRVPLLVETVKRREFEGFTYDGAEASFELLARRILGEVPEYFRVASFRAIDERRWNARGELITMSEATVKIDVQDQRQMTVAEGNGPIHALDSALRKVLLPLFPVLAGMALVDYRVRILTPRDGTRAVTRVMIDSHDLHATDLGRWSTVGVSGNVIDASFSALHDAITYRLFRARPEGVDA